MCLSVCCSSPVSVHCSQGRTWDFCSSCGSLFRGSECGPSWWALPVGLRMRILLLLDRVVCDACPTRGADGAAGLGALPDSPAAGPAASEADSGGLAFPLAAPSVASHAGGPSVVGHAHSKDSRPGAVTPPPYRAALFLPDDIPCSESALPGVDVAAPALLTGVGLPCLSPSLYFRCIYISLSRVKGASRRQHTFGTCCLSRSCDQCDRTTGV